MTNMSPEMRRFGRALERAVAAELETSRKPSRRRSLTLAFVVGVALVSGTAVAATQLIGTDTVAKSLPAGTFALQGTSPTCTEVRAGVEYKCTLDKPPSGEGAPLDTTGNPYWTGAAEPSVDASNHVVGGCRAENPAGTEWRCYLGDEAVTQNILEHGILGTLQAGPSHG